MYYKVVPLFDDNEKDFIKDVSLHIENALEENQEIPNGELVRITKKLIKEHYISFEKFIEVLENNKSNYEMWELNRFDQIFEISMVSKIEKVLFETHKQSLKETERR